MKGISIHPHLGNIRLTIGYWGVIAASLFGWMASVPASAAEPTKHALLVGIDAYRRPKELGLKRTGTGGRFEISNLKGCKNDATVMRELLCKKWGFTIGDEDVLLDSQASRKAILAGLDRLAKAGPGDTVVFYFSGHGSRMEAVGSSEADQLSETIVPADTLLGENDILDKELAIRFNAILDAIGQKGTFTAIFDSCHSGSISRNPLISTWIKRAEPVPFVGRAPTDPAIEPWRRGALIISAARDDEEAAEDRGRNPHRAAFSGALTDVLAELPTNTRAEAVLENARARMKTTPWFTQEPILEGTPLRRQMGLFGESASPTKGVFVAVAPMAGGKVRVEAGLALGIREGCELSKALSSGRRLVLRVEKNPTLTRSTATIVEGAPEDLKSGEYLPVTLWAMPDEPFLRVWAATAIPAELVKRLRLGVKGETDAVEWVPAPELADYHLVGRSTLGATEYSWSRPPVREPVAATLANGQAQVGSAGNSLPKQTAWLNAEQEGTLREQALRLAKVKAWLTLQAPPDGSVFPYRLALRRKENGGLFAGGVAYFGEAFCLSLIADDAALSDRGGLQRRHVYVFAIDSEGTSKLLYPLYDSQENRFPLQTKPDPNEPVDWPQRIDLDLGYDITINPPYGTDTIVMLSTLEPLRSAKSLLEFEGVGGETRGDALGRLLQSRGSHRRRDGEQASPAGWSIFRLTLESRPAKD